MRSTASNVACFSMVCSPVPRHPYSLLLAPPRCGSRDLIWTWRVSGPSNDMSSKPSGTSESTTKRLVATCAARQAPPRTLGKSLARLFMDGGLEDERSRPYSRPYQAIQLSMFPSLSGVEIHLQG